MRITRIYADEHGASHFSDAEVPTTSVQLFAELPPFRVNRFNTPTPIKLFAVPDELDVADWHTAPVRQLAVALNGIVEYEASDGEVRRLAPGEILLVEDTSGRGHITRFADGEQCFLHIPVPDDWTLMD
ncbi:MAG TPA: hypothetical protein VLI93_13980 [Acetobacteraceae bacterium]|nr:hypothetical protein [Acetobacteraceae bacterium]